MAWANSVWICVGMMIEAGGSMERSLPSNSSFRVQFKIQRDLPVGSGRFESEIGSRRTQSSDWQNTVLTCWCLMVSEIQSVYGRSKPWLWLINVQELIYGDPDGALVALRRVTSKFEVDGLRTIADAVAHWTVDDLIALLNLSRMANGHKENCVDVSSMTF